MLRNMATSLIEHERIVTTVPKAKELRRVAEHLVGLAKKGNIHHRQQANAIVRTKPALTKLFEVLGPRYEERQGGYTRILKLARPRVGDKADMCVMEYVDRPGELRAARPPSSRQVDVLANVLRNVGITPLNDMTEAELVQATSELSVKESEEESVDEIDESVKVDGEIKTESEDPGETKEESKERDAEDKPEK
jgi:large subunit ribosomal protein L17